MEEINTEEDSVQDITILAEAGDVNKQICRLCLEIIPSGDCEAIEEIKKEQLEALLINIDFDISDNAVACSKCVEKLQKCFDFKSTCSYVNIPFVNVDIKVDIKPVFKKELSGESTYQENKICRLCMSAIENESWNYPVDSKDLVFFKDMIKNSLPQMDLDTVHESLICNRCLSNTKKYNHFRKTCLEVEQTIQNYRQVVGYGKVVLEDVLEFKNCDTLSQPVIIKKECSNVDFVDMNVMDCPNSVIEKICPDVEYIDNDMEEMIWPKNEDIASIKCEEVDIKDEPDSRVEASESLQSINCNSSAANRSSKKNEQIRTSAPNEARPPMYSCPKCPYSSNERYRIEDHKCHSKYKVHKCFICPFVNNSKFWLSVHMTGHRGSTKALACPECSYETNRKSSLLDHSLKHKDKSEVEIYKCEECKFSTIYKKNFVQHQVIHKNPEEISMYKCEKCGFETKHKKSLTWHKLKHEDPTFARKFKCDKCTYQSKKLSELKTHLMTHSDQHQYSCDQCTYSSTIRQYFVRHKRMHQMDIESEVKFLCDQCDFQTKNKRYLPVHKYLHDPTKSTFKCGQCDYSTCLKARLQKHRLQHMDLGKKEMFYCAMCDFKTKYKSSLVHHIKVCLEKQRPKDGNKKKRRKVIS